MKETTEVFVPKVSNVICDICGNSCKKEYNVENGILTAMWGYESDHDLEIYSIDLCEKCFFETISWLREKQTHKTNPNPLDGREYSPVDPDA